MEGAFGDRLSWFSSRESHLTNFRIIKSRRILPISIVSLQFWLKCYLESLKIASNWIDSNKRNLSWKKQKKKYLKQKQKTKQVKLFYKVGAMNQQSFRAATPQQKFNWMKEQNRKKRNSRFTSNRRSAKKIRAEVMQEAAKSLHSFARMSIKLATKRINIIIISRQSNQKYLCPLPTRRLDQRKSKKKQPHWIRSSSKILVKLELKSFYSSQNSYQLHWLARLIRIWWSTS